MNILGFEVKATRTGVVKGFPYSQDKLPHNRFNVVVVSPEGDRVSFSFFGSYQDYFDGVVKLDDLALASAFYSLLTDAEAGRMTYEEFLENFGYDPEDKNTKKIYKAVQKAAEKVDRLGISEDLFYELMTTLQEYGL